MAQVIFEHVTKRWGDTYAVNDLNINVADKEFLVFVGPSGCGKSTTLRMLAGLTDITSGTIYIGDQAVNDVPPKDRDIAMVFQSYALYPHMSVYDNMAFGLKLRKTPKDEIDRRVRQAAVDLGITDEQLKRQPKALSGGQRQRVAVGRAIVREPAVFLMDEPLSNLDAKLRVEARAMIQRLHHRLEATFIYVTHDQTEAMTMGTRIAVLKDGVLLQIDTPQTLYDRPDNIFVAGFIGSPSMNFFEGALVQDGKEYHVETREFRIKVPTGKKKGWMQSVGRPIILGVRPEDIHDPDYCPPDINPARITATVDVRELMGNEMLLYLNSGEASFVARVDPRSKANIGNTLQLAINADNLHLFDAETELAIR